jgi:hypothetical protein
MIGLQSQLKHKTIVIESFQYISEKRFERLKKIGSFFVIEPFFANHRIKGKIVGFPDPLPEWAEKSISKKEIALLSGEILDNKSINSQANEMAVKTIEAVYVEYQKRHQRFIEQVSQTLQSRVGANTFKIQLCEKLAEFYSVNLLLHRLEELKLPDTTLVYIDTNIQDYFYLKELTSQSQQMVYEHPTIHFPLVQYIASYVENTKKGIGMTMKLLAQSIASVFFSFFRSGEISHPRQYEYGMALVSERQLYNTQRTSYFLCDDKKIKSDDVVIFPLIQLDKSQHKHLEKLGYAVSQKANRTFSNGSEWFKLVMLVLQKNIIRYHNEIVTGCMALSSYFEWKQIMSQIRVRHFITSIGFGVSHIGRNLALNQVGSQTWYYTDSMNSGLVNQEGKLKFLHPYWNYLYYDHFVTWSRFLVQYYYEDHVESFDKYHIVGCLWSGYIEEKKYARKKLKSYNLGQSFVLGVFDTGYAFRGRVDYIQGIAFAEHVLKIANTFSDVVILFKEKMNRKMHHILDHNLGSKLIETYQSMETHPRILFFLKEEETSTIMSACDMVISAPFTSTTFEFLSVNRPAVWHDSTGVHRHKPYARCGDVTTHGYDELEKKVLNIKKMKPGDYQNPFPSDSPLMDPYRDGKAIERFRELLCVE